MEERRKEVERQVRIAMFNGAVKVGDRDMFDDILVEARENSKRKNTILFALFDPKFGEPEMNILVRLNAGKDKESRVIRVAQREVKIGVNRHDVPQISVVADMIEDGNRITHKVSLGQGTEMINFISARK